MINGMRTLSEERLVEVIRVILGLAMALAAFEDLSLFGSVFVHKGRWKSCHCQLRFMARTCITSPSHLHAGQPPQRYFERQTLRTFVAHYNSSSCDDRCVA